MIKRKIEKFKNLFHKGKIIFDKVFWEVILVSEIFFGISHHNNANPKNFKVNLVILERETFNIKLNDIKFLTIRNYLVVTRSRIVLTI